MGWAIGVGRHWQRGAIIALCIVAAILLTILFWIPFALVWTIGLYLFIAPSEHQNYTGNQLVPISGLIILFGLFPIALSIVLVKARALIGLPSTPTDR